MAALSSPGVRVLWADASTANVEPARAARAETDRPVLAAVGCGQFGVGGEALEIEHVAAEHAESGRAIFAVDARADARDEIAGRDRRGRKQIAVMHLGRASAPGSNDSGSSSGSCALRDEITVSRMPVNITTME